MNPDTLDHRLKQVRSNWSPRERLHRALEARRKMEELRELLEPKSRQQHKSSRLPLSWLPSKLAI